MALKRSSKSERSQEERSPSISTGFGGNQARMVDLGPGDDVAAQLFSQAKDRKKIEKVLPWKKSVLLLSVLAQHTKRFQGDARGKNGRLDLEEQRFQLEKEEKVVHRGEKANGEFSRISSCSGCRQQQQ